MLGLSVRQLWWDYIALGGNLSAAAIAGFLDGESGISDHEYDCLVQVLNEHFIERDENHPLLYAEELPSP